MVDDGDGHLGRGLLRGAEGLITGQRDVDGSVQVGVCSRLRFRVVVKVNGASSCDLDRGED